MAIQELADLTSASAITEEQIHRLLNKIDTKLHNVMFPTGDMEDDAMAGLDYEEHGDVGHKVETWRLIEGLLKWKKSLQDALENPAMRGDLAIYVSQWDNPDL